MLRLTLLAPLPLLLAGCGGGDHRADPRGVDHDETLLSVSATGDAESVPDLATIEIGVQTYGANAKAANEANSRKAAEIGKALAAFGVADKDIQTRNLSLSRVEYGPRKGQFEANNLLAVRLHDVPNAGEAVAAATTAGANILSGPALQIEDPETANRGAYTAAYKAARTRAEAYAEAAGMEISRVLAIRDGGQSGGIPMPYANEMAADASAVQVSAPPSIRPGTSRTRVSVQVDFALEEK